VDISFEDDVTVILLLGVSFMILEFENAHIEMPVFLNLEYI
jgi:hypothetical protein